uniref:Uncharacterized protein n=1 Tax=Anguilla anguilla TaxID=7936 RepID=A0A0E9RX31_ANGAN
MISLIAVILA